MDTCFLGNSDVACVSSVKVFIQFVPVRSVHKGRNKFLVFPQCWLNILSFRQKWKPSRNIAYNHTLLFFEGVIFPLLDSRVGTIHCFRSSFFTFLPPFFGLK
jgi:hypothetical protein